MNYARKLGPFGRRRERGQALVLFVLALGVLLGFVAMTVDVGLLLKERRSLQNGVDAAALAGAVELPDSVVLADSKAREWALNNGFSLSAGDQVQVTVSPDNTSVTVEITREASFIFGRVLGLDVTDVHASATARVGSPAAIRGLVPFGVLESAINWDGTPTTMKYDASNPTLGNFGPVRIDGPGAKIHRDTVMFGSTTSLCGASQSTCTDPTTPTQTGNMVGPTRDGVGYRMKNTSTACDEFAEVLIPTASGSYQVSGGCSPWIDGSESLRLVIVPIIDAFPAGTSAPVTVLQFAAFFITDINKCAGNSCEITGIFVASLTAPVPTAELGAFDENDPITFVRLVE